MYIDKSDSKMIVFNRVTLEETLLRETNNELKDPESKTRYVLEELVRNKLGIREGFTLVAEHMSGAETQGFIFRVKVQHPAVSPSYIAVIKHSFPSGVDFSGDITQKKLCFTKGEINRILHHLGLQVVRVYNFQENPGFQVVCPHDGKLRTLIMPKVEVVMEYHPLTARTAFQKLVSELGDDQEKQKKTYDLIESIFLRMAAKNFSENKLTYELLKSTAQKLPVYRFSDYYKRSLRNFNALRQFWFENDPFRKREWDIKYLSSIEKFIDHLSYNLSKDFRRRTKDCVDLGFSDDHTVIEPHLIGAASFDHVTYPNLHSAHTLIRKYNKILKKARRIFETKPKDCEDTSGESAPPSINDLGVFLEDLEDLLTVRNEPDDAAIEIFRARIQKNKKNNPALSEVHLNCEDIKVYIAAIKVFYALVEDFRDVARKEIAPELQGIRFIDRGDRLRWERWTLPIAYARSKSYYLPTDLADRISLNMLAQQFVLRYNERHLRLSGYKLDSSMLADHFQGNCAHIIEEFAEGVTAFVEQSIYATLRRVYRLIIEGEKKYNLLELKGKRDKLRQVRESVVDNVAKVLSKIITYETARDCILASEYVRKIMPFMEDPERRQEFAAVVIPKETELMTMVCQAFSELVMNDSIRIARSIKGDVFSHFSYYNRITVE